MATDLIDMEQALKKLERARKRDRALVTKLRERLEAQEQQLAQQGEQLAELGGATAGLKALMGRATEFTQTVEQFRAAVRQMFDDWEKQQRKKQQEAERARQVEVGTLKDEIVRITAEIQPTRLKEELAAAQAERQRLNKALQRLKSTVTGLNKHAKAAGARLLLLEEGIGKERARLEERLATLRTEEMREAESRREQQVKKLVKQAQEIGQEMEQLREGRERFMQQHQRVRQALKDLEAFPAQLEVRFNEVAEMQRLAENRLKKEWGDWQAALEKEHQQWELLVKEDWKRQGQTNKDHDKRLQTLEGGASSYQGNLLLLCENLAAQFAVLHEQVVSIQENVEAARRS